MNINFSHTNKSVNQVIRTIKDIFVFYRIDVRSVEGYDTLDDIHRSIYKKFIIKFFNTTSLRARFFIKPKSIRLVECIEYLGKVHGQLIPFGGLIYSIDRNGNKLGHDKWEDKRYINFPVYERKSYRYLQFKYEHDGIVEWLTITKKGDWF